ncbi:MAG: GNAT family N-acetyltransferase [Salinarimonas sp.]
MSGSAPPKSAEQPTVRHEDNGAKGRYVVALEGAEAEMTYTRAGESLIIIDHTAVPDALRGRGLGLVLVRRAVEDARAAGRTIIPLCPFAKATIERHREFWDVVKR